MNRLKGLGMRDLEVHWWRMNGLKGLVRGLDLKGFEPTGGE